jgi:hypothetical protein
VAPPTGQFRPVSAAPVPTGQYPLVPAVPPPPAYGAPYTGQYPTMASQATMAPPTTAVAAPVSGPRVPGFGWTGRTPPRPVTAGGVLMALRAARQALDEADHTLTNIETAGDAARPHLRNAAVYGGYAVLFALAQIMLFAFAPADSLIAIGSVGCGLILPLIAFALSWITIGLAFPAGPDDDRVDRTVITGIWMSTLAVVPVVLLAALAVFGGGR